MPAKRSSCKSSPSSPYITTKNCLSASYTDKVIGRDEEYSRLHSLIKNGLETHTSQTLYIAGPAGTGKTLTATTVIEDLKKNFKFKFININCMSFHTNANFCEKIVSNLTSSRSKRLGKGNDNLSIDFNIVENAISASKTMLILLLDEIDQLQTKNHELLNNIFKLPTILSDKIILIGIANALDFTSKVFWLKDFNKDSFYEVGFSPYQKDQIIQILEHRLKMATSAENILIDKVAIEFCARKISSCSGDIRKALDICRRAIDMLENNSQLHSKKTKIEILKENDLQQNGQSENVQITTQVDVKLMMNALNKVYGRVVDKIETESKVFLPSDQQVILCTLLVLLKTKSLREVKLAECRQMLAKICAKRGISSEGKSESEILNMCQFLADYGYVSVKRETLAPLARSPFRSRTPTKKATYSHTPNISLSLKVDPFEAEQLLSTFHKSILSDAELFL